MQLTSGKYNKLASSRIAPFQEVFYNYFYVKGTKHVCNALTYCIYLIKTILMETNETTGQAYPLLIVG